jgi:hypothetical protein
MPISLPRRSPNLAFLKANLALSPRKPPQSASAVALERRRLPESAIQNREDALARREGRCAAYLVRRAPVLVRTALIRELRLAVALLKLVLPDTQQPPSCRPVLRHGSHRGQ